MQTLLILGLLFLASTSASFPLSYVGDYSSQYHGTQVAVAQSETSSLIYATFQTTNCAGYGFNTFSLDTQSNNTWILHASYLNHSCGLAFDQSSSGEFLAVLSSSKDKSALNIFQKSGDEDDEQWVLIQQVDQDPISASSYFTFVSYTTQDDAIVLFAHSKTYILDVDKSGLTSNQRIWLPNAPITSMSRNPYLDTFYLVYGTNITIFAYQQGDMKFLQNFTVPCKPSSYVSCSNTGVFFMPQYPNIMYIAEEGPLYYIDPALVPWIATVSLSSQDGTVTQFLDNKLILMDTSRGWMYPKITVLTSLLASNYLMVTEDGFFFSLAVNGTGFITSSTQAQGYAWGSGTGIFVSPYFYYANSRQDEFVCTIC